MVRFSYWPPSYVTSRNYNFGRACWVKSLARIHSLHFKLFLEIIRYWWPSAPGAFKYFVTANKEIIWKSLGSATWWLRLREWGSELMSLTYSSIWNADGLDAAACLDHGVPDELDLCVPERLAHIHKLDARKRAALLVKRLHVRISERSLKHYALYTLKTFRFT